MTLHCTEGPPQEPSLVLDATRREKRWRNSSAQTLLGVGHYAGQLVLNLVEFPCYGLPFSLLFWLSFIGQGGEVVTGDQPECLPHRTPTRIGRAQEAIALTPIGSEQ